MAEKKNIPGIRFKGFDESWLSKSFSETFTAIPNNSLSRADLNYKSGLAKNSHYVDFLIKFGALIDMGNDEFPFITYESVYRNLLPF